MTDTGLAIQAQRDRTAATEAALAALARRLLDGVQRMSRDPAVPRFEELVEFSAITRPDLSDLEILAREVGLAGLANDALVPLRELLRLKEAVSAIDRLQGWSPDARVRESYPQQVAATVSGLRALLEHVA
jgi:hypothetical protein